MSAPARPRRVLVVEDEYLLADDLGRDLRAAGLEVLGPVSTVAEALLWLDRAEAAVLDVRLGRETAFPVARALRARGLPFVFATGLDSWALPPELADVPRCEKPVDAACVLRALGLPPPGRPAQGSTS